MHPDPQPSRKAHRQQALLLAVVNALVLGIGVVATVDLRRLATPGGTALRWVQAAVFGDCGDYLQFSLPASDAPDKRSDSELCQDLRTATAQARADQLTIGLHLGPVAASRSDALVSVVLTRSGKESRVNVHLVRRDGHWRVVRDAATCSSVGCA